MPPVTRTLIVEEEEEGVPVAVGLASNPCCTNVFRRLGANLPIKYQHKIRYIPTEKVLHYNI
jgi:hypothetical protein